MSVPESESAASITWDWLLACQDCGQQHTFTPYDPERPEKGGTWASPGVYPGTSGAKGGPGHSYRARLHASEVNRLWRLWQAEQEQAATSEVERG